MLPYIGGSVAFVVALAVATYVLGFIPRVPLAYNVRNLLVRWRTTLLTMLAFTLVVGLMTIMLAFVNGMYALAKGSCVAGNVMVLADGSMDEVFSDLGHGDIDLLENRPYIKRITLESGGAKRERPLLSWELYQAVKQPPILHAKPGEHPRRVLQVRGLEDPQIASIVHQIDLREGTWFDPGAGVQAVPGGGSEQYVQAVLGQGLARQLGLDAGRPSLALGDTFTVGPRKWVVVGIMNSAGKTFDSEIWAKRKVIGEMLRKDTRSTATFRVADGLDPAEVARSMTTEFKSPVILAQTEAAYFESLNQTNRQILFAIIGVAIFMGLGGIFGVMNTMFAAVAQRTREIGVLRILGFARWQILLSFFLEGLLLAVLGGVLGCGLGMLCNGLGATSQMSGKSVMLKLVVDYRILAAGLGLSLAMGCIGGLLPALSAIRLKVLDSLR